ncbi:aa3-type cytochrome c oxidase subunit IV [Roseovarius salinarum]|nr:aa3-type cytochrome c oxidase subunit IV [Roseovarius salinarum]
MAEHEHGNMDIEEQEKTFEGFVKASAWVAGLSIAVIVFIGLING